MKEKFPEQPIQPESKNKQKVEIVLPEDVMDAIHHKGKFSYATKDHDERAVNRIEKWLLTANTEEELNKMLRHLQLQSYEYIGDEGGGDEAARVLGNVLKNILFKKQKET